MVIKIRYKDFKRKRNVYKKLFTFHRRLEYIGQKRTK